jgi:MYXO-CTERM domain-containing protein
MKALRVGLGLLLVAASAGATPSGKKWNLDSCGTGTCPEPNQQCTGGSCLPWYKIAASVENTGGAVINGTEGVPYSTVISRTPTDFLAWTTSRVADCNTLWQSVYTGTFTSPSGRNAINGNDNQNLVIFLGGANWVHSAATLALTTTSYYTSSGQIFDADMEVNNNTDWSDYGPAPSYDFESVILHEAGHFLGLDHTPTQSAVMYANVDQGASKRVLTSLDTTDVCTVYPGVRGGQGDRCAAVTDCTGTRVCEGAAGSTTLICTADCTGATGVSCPSGYTCQPSTAGYACLPQVGSSDLCKACVTGQDCTTGLCLTDGAGFNWCSVSCSSNAQCGTGYTCQSLGTGGLGCVPDARCTAQCTGNSGCSVGFGCTNGACVATGNPGDRCEASNYCKSCGVCVIDPNDSTVAFCRSCCGGSGAGGFCSACSATSCTGSGTACTSLSNNADSACLPSSGVTSCGVCSASSPCQTGLTCVSGKCHSACNPSNPGTCGACLDQGTGTGVCACSDEVAHAGEACGTTTGGGIAACATGLTCVSGNPGNVCRAKCSATDASSCGAGETCTAIGNQYVCLGAATGGRCAACNSDGSCNGGLTCYMQRCYPPCDITSTAACSTCIQTDVSGAGVCACTDQIVGEGQSCGYPQVAACSAGLSCLNGKCSAKCDPALMNCPTYTICRTASDGNYYCQSPDTGTGGGGGDTGGGAGGSGGGGRIVTGGGSGGGTVTAEGCGCSTGTDAFGVLALGLVTLLRRRRA